MAEKATEKLIRLLRWSEKYTKTDMVYLARVGLWSNLNIIVISLLAFLLSVAFANLLSPEEYGTYQYLLSLSALLTAITLAGMNRAVTQSVARGFEGDLRASVRLQLAWSVIPACLGLFGAFYYFLHGNSVLGIGLVAIALLSPLTNVWNTYSAFLNGKKEFRQIFFSNLISYVAYYGSIFPAIFLFRSATVLLIVNLASNAAATCFLYYWTLKRFAPNDRTDPQTIPYGKHLSIMNAFGTTITQFDSILVFHFLGPAQLAVYSFASMLPERIGGVLNFVGNAALPKFANRSRSEINQTILSKIVRALLAGAVLAGLYALSAPLIFSLLFPRYLHAVPYTQVYAIAIVMMAATNIVSSALYSQRLKFELYVVSFVNPLLLLVLQVPLLLLYGIMGILVAKILSDAVNIILGIVLLMRVPQSDTPERI